MRWGRPQSHQYSSFRQLPGVNQELAERQRLGSKSLDELDDGQRSRLALMEELAVGFHGGDA